MFPEVNQTDPDGSTRYDGKQDWTVTSHQDSRWRRRYYSDPRGSHGENGRSLKRVAHSDETFYGDGTHQERRQELTGIADVVHQLTGLRAEGRDADAAEAVQPFDQLRQENHRIRDRQGQEILVWWGSAHARLRKYHPGYRVEDYPDGHHAGYSVELDVPGDIVRFRGRYTPAGLSCYRLIQEFCKGKRRKFHGGMTSETRKPSITWYRFLWSYQKVKPSLYGAHPSVLQEPHLSIHILALSGDWPRPQNRKTDASLRIMAHLQQSRNVSMVCTRNWNSTQVR